MDLLHHVVRSLYFDEKIKNMKNKIYKNNKNNIIMNSDEKENDICITTGDKDAECKDKPKSRVGVPSDPVVLVSQEPITIVYVSLYVCMSGSVRGVAVKPY